MNRSLKTDSPKTRRLVRRRWVWAGLLATAGLAAGLVSGSAIADPNPGDGGSDVQPQIVGGHAASEPYPWMVSLQYDTVDGSRVDWHTCGGLLIFRGWVVTNAHCVTDPPADVTADRQAALASHYRLDNASLAIPVKDKRFHVRIGSHDRTAGGVSAEVTAVVVHPGWQWGAGAPDAPVNDIALLKLDHLVDVQTIELAGAPARAGDRTRLLGWGVTEPDGNGPLPTRLQELDTTVEPARHCAAAFISAGEICTRNPHGTDGPCFGDSGGPALKQEDGRWKLVGGTSRMSSPWCGTDSGVYTSSPNFRRWIYDTARGPTAAVPAPAPIQAPPAEKEPTYGLPYEPGGAMAAG